MGACGSKKSTLFDEVQNKSDVRLLKERLERNDRPTNATALNEKNEKDRGNTALHLATINSNIEAVRLLLSHNADVNVKNDNGETALDLATAAQQTEIIALLTSVTHHNIPNTVNGHTTPRAAIVAAALSPSLSSRSLAATAAASATATAASTAPSTVPSTVPSDGKRPLTATSAVSEYPTSASAVRLENKQPFAAPATFDVTVQSIVNNDMTALLLPSTDATTIEQLIDSVQKTTVAGPRRMIFEGRECALTSTIESLGIGPSDTLFCLRKF